MNMHKERMQLLHAYSSKMGRREKSFHLHENPTKAAPLPTDMQCICGICFLAYHDAFTTIAKTDISTLSTGLSTVFHWKTPLFSVDLPFSCVNSHLGREFSTCGDVYIYFLPGYYTSVHRHSHTITDGYDLFWKIVTSLPFLQKIFLKKPKNAKKPPFRTERAA